MVEGGDEEYDYKDVGKILTLDNMTFCEEFKRLIYATEWRDKYIGEGNPNADILIVGQECAIDQFDKDKKWLLDLYNENWRLWKSNLQGENNLSYDSIKQWTRQADLKPERYNPFLPYKGQTFSCRKSDGTSRTCYNYQKLINMAADENNGISKAERYHPMTLYKHCFVTELNDFCIPNHSLSPKQLSQIEQYAGESVDLVIEHHIGARYNMIINHDGGFFKRFKVVLLATGKQYMKKLDKKAMFGAAEIIEIAQASRWKEEDYLKNGQRIMDYLKP